MHNIKSVVYTKVRVVVHHNSNVDPMTDVMKNPELVLKSNIKGSRVAEVDILESNLHNSRPLMDDELTAEDVEM